MSSMTRDAAALDTSVWINLFATGRAERIIEALGFSILLPPQILRELRRDPVTGSAFDKDDHPALKVPHVEATRLDAAEATLFVDLVSGTHVSGLGDGEAAAIVLGVSRGAVVAIDENKARNLLKSRFPHITIIDSSSILLLPFVVERLGKACAEECYELARKFGRMHVRRMSENLSDK